MYKVHFTQNQEDNSYNEITKLFVYIVRYYDKENVQLQQTQDSDYVIKPSQTVNLFSKLVIISKRRREGTKISPSEEHKEKQCVLRTIGFAKLQSKLGTLFDISVKLWRSEKIVYKYASTAIYGLREERQFDVENFWCCSIYWVDI